MHSIFSVFVPMAEKKIPKINTPSDQLSDSDTPEEEADPRLRTSEEERQYWMIKGSTQATQASLSLQTLQSPDEPNCRKRPTTETQNKEITQRQNSRKGHPD